MADHESHNAALIRGMLEKYKQFEAAVKEAMETKLRKAYEKIEKLQIFSVNLHEHLVLNKSCQTSFYLRIAFY